MPKIYVHGSYIGTTGYNNHTRDFFRELSKYSQIKVRNFTVGNTWDGLNDSPHDKEPYLNEIDKSLLYGLSNSFRKCLYLYSFISKSNSLP